MNAQPEEAERRYWEGTVIDGDRELWGTRDDSELLALARRGDAAAFSALWRRHHPRVIALLRPLAQDEAEDVVAEAFARAWAQLLDGGGPETHFKAYVICIAKRFTYRLYREKQLFSTEHDLESIAVSRTREPISSYDTRRQIEEAFDAIPARWGEVLWLRRVEGRSRAEVCERLGVSPNALSSLTRRARIRFREAFELAGA